MLCHSVIIGRGFRLEHCNFKAGYFMYFVYISLIAQVFLSPELGYLQIFEVMGAFGQLAQGGMSPVQILPRAKT